MRPGPIEVIACPGCEALVKRRTISSGSSLGARVWTDGREELPMAPEPPTLARCRVCRLFYRPAQARRVGVFPAGVEFDAMVHTLTISAIAPGARAVVTELRALLGPASEAELRARLPLTIASGLSTREAGTRGWSLGEKGAQVTFVASVAPDYDGPTPRDWLAAPDLTPPGELDLLDAVAQTEPDDRTTLLALRTQAWQAANDPRRGRDPALPVDWSDAARDNLERLVVMLGEQRPDERVRKAEALRELGRFEEALQQQPRTRGRHRALALLVRSLAERGHAGVTEIPQTWL